VRSRSTKAGGAQHGQRGAGRGDAAHERPQGGEIVERPRRSIGRQVAPAGLEHAEFAQVAAH
jgi:hypothetical protein